MDKKLIKTWKRIVESSINEGWVGKEGDKAYYEMLETFQLMDQQKILDMLFSWLSQPQLENFYKWMIEEEYIQHNEDDEEFDESCKKPLNEESIKFHLKIYGNASDFGKYASKQTNEFLNQIHLKELDEKFDEYFEKHYPMGLDITKFDEIIRTDGNKIIEQIETEEIS